MVGGKETQLVEARVKDEKTTNYSTSAQGAEIH
jgi:hypothetical protein